MLFVPRPERKSAMVAKELLMRAKIPSKEYHIAVLTARRLTGQFTYPNATMLETVEISSVLHTQHKLCSTTSRKGSIEHQSSM